MTPYFERYNRNPWKKNIPDCVVRSVSLATNIPYVEVCRRLGVSYRNGHGLIRNSGIVMEQVKSAFDSNFDIVVDFEEELPDEELKRLGGGIPLLYDDDETEGRRSTEQTLTEWMDLNRFTGTYVVGLHNSTNTQSHLVCVSTRKMKFYDTWDCGNWKVDCWCRVIRREPSETK